MTTKPLTLLTSTLLLTVTLAVPAQIVTDGTVGPGRALNGPDYQISDDLGRQSGPNLFHSFDQFNINTSETATFTGPPDLDNVFGRVTGGGQSWIDGKIRSEIPSADIYLINPNGILFGENASLDVPGSFYASTANQIILEDGTEFSATNPSNSPILSAEPFEAFGFLDDNQAPLSVQGSTLEVAEEQTLGLASHKIDIKGQAQINSGGQIEIDSHPNSSATPTTITVEDSKITVRSEGQGRIFFQGGQLFINKSKIQMRSEAPDSSIKINASQMSLTNDAGITMRSNTAEVGDLTIGEDENLDSLEINRSTIRTNTDSSKKAGNVRITTKTLQMQRGEIQAQTSGSGNAGSVRLSAEKIEMTDGSQINTETSATGNAGGIGITAADQSLNLILTDSKIFADSYGNGNGGRISIDSSNDGTISLSNSSIQANTLSSGQGGHLTLNAQQINLTENSGILSAAIGQEAGSGNAGSLEIDTNHLNVTDSTIAAGTIGPGTGGNVRIKATESITLSGNSSILIAEDGQPPLSAITVGTQGTTEQSDAGNANIETPNLTLTNQATINAGTTGPGDAGDLTIKADEIHLTDNSEIRATTLSTGQGGNVQIQTNHLQLNQARLTADTFGPGNAGDLTIQADEIHLTDNSEIRATTSGSGHGGQLEMNANQIILTDNSGLIVASLSQQENAGNAGSLAINTGTLNVNNSTIAAGTLGSGDGSESVQIKARESITLSGESSNHVSNEQILGGTRIPLFAIMVDSRGSGNATSSEQPVSIETPILTLDNGAAISVATFGSGQGGRLEITADEALSIDQSNIVSATLGSGTGGYIKIKTKNMTLSGKSDNFLSQYDLSNISSATFGAGQGGEVQIETGQLRLDNAAISARARQTGNAGTLTINASQLITNNQSEISTEAQNSLGGNITINTPELIVTNNGSINADVINGDRGGNIDITVNTLDISKGGQLKSSSQGQGLGGNVTISASRYINLFDGSETGLLSSTTDGRAGQITVTTPQLNLSQGKINTSATSQGHSGSILVGVSELNMTDDSSMSAKNSGSGDAGSIIINAATGSGSVTINNSEITTESEQQGAGGLINIHARDLILQNQAEMNAKVNNGRGGANIEVTVDRLTLEEGGRIESSTVGSSRAGKITITASEYLNMTGNDSGIFSQAEGTTGAAGEILIGTTTVPVQSLTIENGGQISTASEGTGRVAAESANIEIIAEQLRLKQGTIKSSTDGQNPAGTISIIASEYIDISKGEILSESSQTGAAGQIIIGQENQPVQTLTIENGGKISTTASGDGRTDANAANIRIYATNVTLGDETDHTSGYIESSTDGQSPAGNLTINASNDISLYGDSHIEAQTSGTGKGGQIHLIANRVDMNNDSSIESSTNSAGHAGQITITASEYLNIFGGQILSNSENKATGNAGQIIIGKENQPVQTLTLTNGGQISTTTLGKGAGGKISLTANRLDISEGSQIESSTKGTSNAGQITITASEYLNLFDGEILSTSGDKDNTEATGNAGKINIVAGGRQNDRKEVILGREDLTAEFFPIENDIETLMEKRGLTLNGGQISTSTEGVKGRGGEITITTSQLKLTNQAEISATSGQDVAGNIIIGTDLLGMSDSSISTESSASGGGNIFIGLNNLYGKRITNSTLSARAGGQGGGGNLEIIGGAPYIILDNTDIIAEAEQGEGGNIKIEADKAFIASGDSRVSASSQRDDGEVTIDSAQVDIGSLIPLPNDPVDASKLIKDCAATSSTDDESSKKEGQWSLIQVGRDGQKGTGCLR